MSCRFFLFSLIFFQANFILYGQDRNSKVDSEKKSFGPIVKIEPSGFIHHYSKVLVGVEYFISQDVSLQHHIGPVVTVENYNFDRQDYDKFWGFAFNNELRYYFFNTLIERPALYEQMPNRTIKTGYFGLELNYSYTDVDANSVLEFDCASGDCNYYQEIEEKVERNWFGSALVVGGQFIVNRKVSIDINGGLGLRWLWLDREPLPEGAGIDHRGLNINNEEKVFIYPSLGFNIGYCLN